MTKKLLLVLVLLAGTLIYFSTRKNPSPKIDSVKTTENKKTNFKVESGQNQVLTDLEFPSSFTFGAASSDFQTTGGNGKTDWNDYINNAKPPFVGPNQGTDFINRYRQDFRLAAQIGIQIQRLSLEWARIQPEKGKWDYEAIKKYKEIFLYMRALDIEPMICLNHFAIPKWFSDIGGWENPQASLYYSLYAKFVAKEIGLPLKIKWWLTFNEPQLVIVVPYQKGSWPPFKPVKNLRDQEGTKRLIVVASHVIDAHRLAYRNIHKILDPYSTEGSKIMVGFASAPGSFYPIDSASPTDLMITNVFNAINVLLFDYAIGSIDRDFIGLNYYGRAKLRLHISIKSVLPWLNENKPIAVEWQTSKERAGKGRPKEFYPKALYDLIMQFKEINLPIIITENGLDDGEDKFREEFIVIHLKAVHDAMKDGANVIGYQYWALTDTWEWDGVFSQMGLISIDRENDLTRKIRPSAFTYRDIIKKHKISKELLKRHSELLNQKED